MRARELTWRTEPAMAGDGAVWAPGVLFGDGVRLGPRTRILPGALLLDGVDVGPDCVIGPYAVLGEPVRAFYRDSAHRSSPTVVGAGAVIRSRSTIYSDVEVGEGFECGVGALIREGTRIGNNVRIGSYSDLEGELTVGDYTRIHSNVHIAQGTTIGRYVWMHPFSVIINDQFPPTGLTAERAVVGDFSVIGAGALLFPAARLGRHVIVAAGSRVTSKVADYQLVRGDPAQVICDARRLVTETGGKIVRPYPWMQHNRAGYPWEREAPREWFLTAEHERGTRIDP